MAVAAGARLPAPGGFRPVLGLLRRWEAAGSQPGGCLPAAAADHARRGHGSLSGAGIEPGAGRRPARRLGDAQPDLHSKAETVRLRIAQELPEFVQLMAAESASGAALETVIRRAAQGTTQTAAWFRRVLEGGSGKALFLRDGEGGYAQAGG